MMIARLIALVVFACSCNRVFDLDPTQAIDAPPSAAVACPELGTAPRFSRVLHEISPRGCKQYTFSAATRLAMAECYDLALGRYIGEGKIDGPLLPADGLTDANGTIYQQPRTHPDGTRVFVQTTDFTFQTFDNSGGAWLPGESLPFSGGSHLGTIATGPAGDRVMVTTGNSVQEWLRGATWEPFGDPYDAFAYGIGSFGGPAAMTTDGLRLLISGQRITSERYEVLYAGRQAVADRFAGFVPVEGIPNTPTIAFMTDDCTRVYVAGLQRIFFVELL